MPETKMLRYQNEHLSAWWSNMLNPKASSLAEPMNVQLEMESNSYNDELRYRGMNE
jgi:hypothetical protein